MKKLLYIFVVAALILTSCSQKNKFSVSGSIADAKSQMLFFEHVGDGGLEVLDSVKLKANGKFKFKAPKAEYPDFYRLRLGNEAITLGIDSCEQIIIKGQKEDFGYNYTVNGSISSEIILELKKSSREVFRQLSDTTVTKTLLEADSIIEIHRELARSIIIENTRSSAAYYAVAQTINGHYYFSIDDHNDRKMWAAVATAHKVYYPNSPRTQALEEAVVTSMQGSLLATLPTPDEELGAIDLSLPNIAGDNVTLSSLRGKVVLLDFFAYDIDGAIAYLRFLNDIYTKYHDKGLEIYQISIDQDKLFWAEHAREMPWISVRDSQAPYSKALMTYNVRSLPTSFLLNQQGDIVGRFGADRLESEIAKLLD